MRCFGLSAVIAVGLAAAFLGAAGCAGSEPRVERRVMEVTAYCPCGECCGWQRGSDRWMRIDFWRRYVNVGSRAGRPYTGRTASGTRPRTPRPGLFSRDSLSRPWVIPARMIPWRIRGRPGTIAADPRHYPFGTVIDVPGWGRGVVEDRGGAIRGPDKLDLFHRTHRQALRWGRQHVEVAIHR